MDDGVPVRTWRAVLASPACVLHLPKGAWKWTAIYLAVGGVLLAALTVPLLVYEGEIFEALSSYVLPDSWPYAIRWFTRKLLEQQTHLLAANAIATAAGLLVSLLLFPLRARMSKRYEIEGRLCPDPLDELPLWQQALQEIKLALFFAAAQASLFWAGYFHHPALNAAALALSYVLLFGTYAVNFLALLWQRHRGYYSQVVKVVARRPLESLLFGAIFALPSVAVGFWWKLSPGWTRAETITALFFVALVSSAWAVLAGTYVAARWYPIYLRTKPASRATSVLGWLLIVLVLSTNAWLFVRSGLAVHHKSQVLKCNYQLDSKSVRFETPNFGELLDGQLTLRGSAEVVIENPTRFDFSVERNRLEIRHKDELVSETRLSPFEVRAGRTIRQRIELSLRVRPSFVLHGLSLFKGGWSVVLYLDVGAGFDLPIYLVKP
jgi:hypothetical protein